MSNWGLTFPWNDVPERLTHEPARLTYQEAVEAMQRHGFTEDAALDLFGPLFGGSRRHVTVRQPGQQAERYVTLERVTEDDQRADAMYTVTLT